MTEYFKIDPEIIKRVRDALREAEIEEPPFQKEKWEIVKPEKGTPFVRCELRRQFTGDISFSTSDISRAKALFEEKRLQLADAFDQLTLKPPIDPHVKDTDWEFEYDSWSVTPQYKYSLVHGTLGEPKRGVRFIMRKKY